jgi:hypothetical protein
MLVTRRDGVAYIASILRRVEPAASSFPWRHAVENAWARAPSSKLQPEDGCRGDSLSPLDINHSVIETVNAHVNVYVNEGTDPWTH